MDQKKKNNATVVFFDELGFGWLMNPDQIQWLRDEALVEQEWDHRIVPESILQPTSA